MGIHASRHAVIYWWILRFHPVSGFPRHVSPDVQWSPAGIHLSPEHAHRRDHRCLCGLFHCSSSAWQPDGGLASLRTTRIKLGQDPAAIADVTTGLKSHDVSFKCIVITVYHRITSYYMAGDHSGWLHTKNGAQLSVEKCSGHSVVP